jgi:hypothetical protein
MELIIAVGGVVRCVYGETLCLQALGPMQIQRASHVEPDCAGRWWADLSPVAGPLLGPFAHRSAALVAEATWLSENWLTAPHPLSPKESA